MAAEFLGPLQWLDSFSMRNFTNAGVFEDTLPLADGRMEIGWAVPIEQLKDAREDWFQRKGLSAQRLASAGGGR